MGITLRAAVLVLSCCAVGAQAFQHRVHTLESQVGGDDRCWSELNSSMERMHRRMASVEPSGNSDVDFAAQMLPHHQAAIDMARTELLCGTDPALRRLAQEIITEQQSEIEVMQLWVKHR
jgi:uncharacterized protein (DUF305 family)